MIFYNKAGNTEYSIIPPGDFSTLDSLYSDQGLKLERAIFKGGTGTFTFFFEEREREKLNFLERFNPRS